MRFEDAERNLLEQHGLRPRDRRVQLREPLIRARVLEQGEGDPLFLVHGGGSFAAMWAPLMAELDGYKMFAVDRPGCGLSDPFLYSRDMDLRRHAVSFLEGTLDELGLDTVSVVANSMGGLWTLWLALDRPERVSSIVQLGCPAVLLDSGAPFGLRLMGVRRLNQWLARMQPPSREQVLQVWERMGDGNTIEDIPGAIDAYIAYEQNPACGAAWFTLLESVVRLTGTRFNLGADELARVRQRTLFVWGENDKFGSPQVGRRAVDIMPNAELQVLPGGHLPWLRHPRGIANSIRRFLEAGGARSEVPELVGHGSGRLAQV
ncbi:MAG TPA: alpha/beta hydrolase [Actinomycetota bacterium]|nr:alpha/beta hydrolase [Actinomycetota bacterium]